MKKTRKVKREPGPNEYPNPSKQVCALRVIAWDKRIRKFLEKNDPKALEQVNDALIDATGSCAPPGLKDLVADFLAEHGK
jgi:hypothetical protein